MTSPDAAPLSGEETLAIEALGYTARWVESGLLDRALLAEQFARFQDGGTRKTGTYRGRAVSAWLDGRSSLDDAQVDTLLSLLADDPDGKMAQAAVSELIQSPAVSLAQLDRISACDPKLVKRHEKLIRRIYLLRRLDDGVSDELFEVILSTQDAALHTALLRDERLARKHAEGLAQRGANPTIRERAQAWVLEKKAWR